MSAWGIPDPPAGPPPRPPGADTDRRGGLRRAVAAALISALLVLGLVVGLTWDRGPNGPRNRVAGDRASPSLPTGTTAAVTTGRVNRQLEKLTYRAAAVTLQIDAPTGWYQRQNRNNNSGDDVAMAFLQRHVNPDGYLFGSSVWVGNTPERLTDLREAATRAVLWNAQHAYSDLGKLNVSSSRAVTVNGHAGWEITGTVTYDIPGIPWNSDSVYTLAIKFETGEVLQAGYAVITDEAADRAAGTASMHSLVITDN